MANAQLPLVYRQVPWKSIVFAMFLLTTGVTLLVLSHFASRGKLGYSKGPKANEQVEAKMTPQQIEHTHCIMHLSSVYAKP